MCGTHFKNQGQSVFKIHFIYLGFLLDAMIQISVQHLFYFYIQSLNYTARIFTYAVSR